MDNGELGMLRDLLDAFLGAPAAVREALLRLLKTSAPVRGPRIGYNGLGHEPPPVQGPQRRKRRYVKPDAASARAAESALLELLRGCPEGLGVTALAKMTNSYTATTAARLERMALRGEAERGGDGKWRVVEENPPKPALATARA
jgi:hypothetical protein